MGALVDQFGRPIRKGNAFHTPAWLVSEVHEQMNRRLEFEKLIPRVVLTDSENGQTDHEDA